jgi:hypothetical protein
MQLRNVSSTLFIAVLLILLLNAAVSTANVIEDDAVLQRLAPALRWTAATLIWIAFSLGEARDDSKE